MPVAVLLSTFSTVVNNSEIEIMKEIKISCYHKTL